MKGPEQDEFDSLSGSPLHAPLGLNQRRRGPPSHLSARQLAIGASVVAVVGISVLVWRGKDSNGEPYAVARIERVAPEKPAAAAPPAAGPVATAPDVTGSIPPRASGAEVEAATGVKVTRGTEGGDVPAGLIIQVPKTFDMQLTPAPDRRLVEKGPYGPLPKIGADGSRPMEVYARPLINRADGRAPAKLALMIGGMGLNIALTREAINQLPGAVTLGFAPYGSELDSLVAEARSAGHEVILQSPMESFGESDDPGPFVLKTSQDKGQIVDNLRWQMSRFQGYIGIAGFLGARFTASEPAFSPVLREIGQRGLLYLDDASSPRSLARSLSQGANTAFVGADLLIDSRSADEIDVALAQLESMARDKGMAVGTASGLPIVMERVARFTKTLENRGITLVPISALAVRGSAVSSRTRR
ncbi:divergent polysaccharide deacetylase family protein [Methylocella sp. CPCC 101449]|uniref:divergent polysaccharide deacetylase family protein n=1 Tax=Methylocella sp. CPCC 101449 TaxID=2987531 RepID=UPI00288F3F64|nr:divergent polysaccharide deacetylase family protein [Methylocella sp. CPCC 101449]MDT2020805.1 divergent polysaccharide deacetylase family protein [Methylocella sp. CPCC 101449]